MVDLNTIKWVVNNAEYVSIDYKALEKFVTSQIVKDYDYNFLLKGFKFQNLKEYFNFIFIFNSIHFAFWNHVTWYHYEQGEWIRGAKALAFVLKKHLDQNSFDPKFISQIDLKEFYKIIDNDSKGHLILKEERWRVIKNVSTILNYKYNGDFHSLVANCNYDAVKILNEIVENFPDYNDIAIYKNQEVQFYKKAQLTISMCNFISDKKFTNLDKLTIFADYRIPQLFNYLGILNYNKDLLKRIERKIELEPFSPEEIEIRAATIFIAQKMQEIINEKYNKNFIATDLDNYLWNYAKSLSPKTDLTPHHRIQTIFY